MTNFLPDGFDKLKMEKPYWRMSQMVVGDNRLRIVQRPIAGWIEFHEKNPYRYRPEQKPKKSKDPAFPLRPFWSCYVWDYAREGLYVLEITQAMVIKSLTGYAEDPDWGDFTTYDLKVKKEGSGMETRYYVTPLPHKPISAVILQALAESPAYLENLYDGGDPWDAANASSFSEGPDVPVKVTVEPIGHDLPSLKAQIKKKGIDIAYLEDYLRSLAEKKGQPLEKIIESATNPQIFSNFSIAYAKAVEARLASTF